MNWVTMALSPGLKRLFYEADHLPPSSAEFKNVWGYTSSPHTYSWRDTWLSTRTNLPIHLQRLSSFRHLLGKCMKLSRGCHIVFNT